MYNKNKVAMLQDSVEIYWAFKKKKKKKNLNIMTIKLYFEKKSIFTEKVHYENKVIILEVIILNE